MLLSQSIVFPQLFCQILLKWSDTLNIGIVNNISNYFVKKNNKKKCLIITCV